MNKKIKEIDEVTFITKYGVTKVFGYGVNVLGDVSYIVIGRIYYSEKWGNYTFKHSWRCDSFGITTFEQIIQKMKELRGVY